MVIYTHGADAEDNGLQMPTTQVNYHLIKSTQAGAVVEQHRWDTNIGQLILPRLTITGLHRTASVFNIFTIEFVTTITVDGTAGEEIIVEFPTRSPDGTLMFFDDLGTGIPNHKTCPCEEFTGIVGSPTILCTLEWGDSNQGTGAKVHITGFASIGAGTYSFVLPRFKNP